MVGQDGYYDLLELLDGDQVIDPGGFFDILKNQYGVSNIAYLDVTPAPSAWAIHAQYHTYGDDWENTYRDKDFHLVDPVLQQGLAAARPLDWSTVRATTKRSEAMFAEAGNHGIQGEGITFPLISRGNRAAIFTINSDVTKREWRSWRRQFSGELQVLTSYFHAAILAQSRSKSIDKISFEDEPKRRKAPLTDRETEVLAWAAAGKSYWEISVILGISERTVRFFMSNTRRKLNVVSNTQAVAQAVWRGLIPPA